MKKVKCGTCGCVVDVENPTAGMACPNCSAKLIGENAKITNTCFFCGKEIGSHEAEIFCPGCGTEYHADCWIDHDGCGVEGCAYQEYLAPMEIPTAASSAPAHPHEAARLNSEPVIPDPEEGKNGKEAKAGEDYFVINSAPKAPEKNRKDEAQIINERMETIRRREEMPEQKKISWQDVLDWKNTPRDTKYDFDGPWFKDPYLLQKAKNYLIFLVGGLMGGAVLGVSLGIILGLFKYLLTGGSFLSYGSMVFIFFVGLLAGMAAAVYFAYRTMATLIDN